MRGSMIIAALPILIMPGSVYPQSCGNLPTQAEMNQCAAADYAKVDRELNRVYGDYRSRLSDDKKKQLRDVQLAWIRFRDLSCKFESSGVEGGSIHPLILNSCLAGLTRERLKQLSALATCKEGDLSCPAWK